MATNVTGLAIWIHFQVDTSPPYFVIDYTPIVQDSDPSLELSELHVYHAQFQTKLDDLPPALREKLLRINDYVFSAVDVPEITFGGITGKGTVTPVYFQTAARSRHDLHATYRVNGDLSCGPVPVSDATERLLENIWPMCEQMAWDHLRQRLGAPTAQTSTRKRVYLCYRKGSEPRRAFVEAVAHRVGREGFLPWLDTWEIHAGDSLPREMADGLKDAYAIIIVLSPDFQDGKWAREELETAITQRVERNIKIIPVMYETCDRPVLLQPLRYVDCTAHEPDQFESQFLEIIDALNDIELNPYRR